MQHEFSLKSFIFGFIFFPVAMCGCWEAIDLWMKSESKSEILFCAWCVIVIVSGLLIGHII